jgi:hypothetical protein
MMLYKFLSADHALDDIQKHRLKISLFGTLNDPYDLMNIAYKDIDVGRAVQATKDRLGEKSGILCFSSDWKDPVIWTHYADTHQGICLGFDSGMTQPLQVWYSDYMIPERALTDALGDPVKLEKVVTKMLRTKFRSWMYEKEFRLWGSLDVMENGLYFCTFKPAELTLREVVLGMKCKTTIQDVTGVLQTSGYGSEVALFQATPSPTKFEMVPQVPPTR